MPQTVIGLFHQLSDARSAETTLLGSGFSRETVDLSAGGTAAAPTGAGATGNATPDDGAVKRFFNHLFTASEADRYAGVASQSEAVLTVHAANDDQAERAKDILDNAGATDVDAHAEQYASDGSLKVIQENLQVGKRTVETGGARIRSRIVEREVSQDIRLKQERVVVRRSAVDRVANAADLAAFREGQIEVVEHAEVPVVSKEARVIEEVSLRKEQDERTETVRDTVRGTEVKVEKIDTTKKPR